MCELPTMPEDLGGRPSSEILAEMASALQAADSILITAHVHPDGDALGSEWALALALLGLGKRVTVAHNEDIPDRYIRCFQHACRNLGSLGSLDSLDSLDNLVEVVDASWVKDHEDAFSWCVVLDTSEPERIGVLAPLVYRDGQSRMCLDHHLHEDRKLYDYHLLLRRAASTANLVLALLDALGVEISAAIAEFIWLGVSTDTGWFRFPNTTPGVLRDAGRLLSAGRFNPEEIYESVYGGHGLGRTRILGEVLLGLVSDLEGRFLWGMVTRKQLEQHAVARSELEGVIDAIKSIRGAEVAALITEVKAGSYKISLRSSGGADVERVARAIGGGGHKKAAGCSFQGSLDTLLDRLRAEVASGFSPVE